MSIKAKSRLSEFCQKNKLPIPKYSSEKFGLAHSPKWTSEVIIETSNKIFRAESNSQVDRKADAEEIAAEQILIELNSYFKVEPTKLNIPNSNSKIEPTKLNISNLSGSIYLIDLENKPQFHNTDRMLLNSKSIYIGFISSTHHAVEKYDRWQINDSDEIKINSTNCLLYMVEGGIADLVDHFITAISYVIINFIKSNKDITTINIISSDHAGWCTKYCMEKIANWHKISDRIKILVSSTIKF